jgi:hypothetical protein
MKNMLPILSVALIAALAALSAGEQSPQTTDNKEFIDDAHPASSRAGVAVTAGTTSGQELIRQAAQQLLVMPGIEAKTRQRVDLFDQQLIGSGSYLQLARGPKLMLRLDLKLQAKDQVASLLQVSDGDFLWIRRDLPEGRSLGRVDLRKLRQVAGQTPVPVPASYWMALGGIPQLLVRLDESFLFQTPQATQIGELPVWQLEGHWRPEQLALMLPNRREAIMRGDEVPLDELPAHQPHGVTLILGRDQVIPLFPYGLSFFRRDSAGDAQGGAGERRPLVTLELFEVRFRGDLTPEDFRYRPGNQQVEEQTEAFVARLNAAAKKAQR